MDIPADLQQVTIRYASSIDGLAPLLADVIFCNDGAAKPLTAVLHGFHCTRGHVTADCIALARRGLFCVTPDMRGHGDSAGSHDCGGLQIYDIVDALAEAARQFPRDCDAGHVNAVGYSGGGGNVLSLATKFPQLLQAGASFFGISDYDLWYRTQGRVDCNRTMERALGGKPEDVPGRYAARSSLRAIGNNPHTRLHLFWDAEETACPPVLNQWLAESAARLGHTNIITHASGPGDAARWIHGYRTGVPQLEAADEIFAPDFLASRGPWPMPVRGTLDVAGYVVTSRFSAWLGDGLSGLARIHYDLSGPSPRVSLLHGADPARLRIGPGFALGL